MGLRYVADHTTDLSETQQITHETGSILAKKIWLPKFIYAALPWFYLIAGSCALVATIYIGHWTWVLPHYALFSIACLHMGLLIYRRRHNDALQS